MLKIKLCWLELILILRLITSSGIILDDTRLKLHAKTIKELSNKGAKVVLLAHQSRPGKKDFTDLSQHANALSDLLNLRVKYIDSIFSKAAKEAIKQLKPHEILLLENVRFFSEESLSRPAEAQAETLLVRQLSPVIDYFVNDAFAAAHRSPGIFSRFYSQHSFSCRQGNGKRTDCNSKCTG